MTVDLEAAVAAADADEAVRPHLVSFDTDSFVRPVHRFVWQPVPAPLAPGGSSVTGRRLLVLGEVPQLVAAVAAALREAGATVDESTPDAEAAAAPWDGIIDLNMTGRPYDLGDTGWRDALARTTRMLHHRYRDWQAETTADRCCYLVVTAMGGLMGYRHCDNGQPLGGIWAGIAKGLPREMPTVAVKIVDVETATPDLLARTVLAELSSWDLFEIGYRQGTRYALTAQESPIGPTRLKLGAEDVVLISGGARGVGFALARGLAEEFGCQVVVTGRGPLPRKGTGGPLDADDAEFEQQQRARLDAAQDTQTLRKVRSQLRRESDARQVFANLTAAARDGLPISYEACDVTDATQVRDLLSRIPAPTVVVHNAGIDEPKRLDRKTPDEVVRTIDVKVSGFANLARELLAEPSRRAALKVFCNVGSLAGRMGGMIGQVDYGSANESLARLGFWARDTHGLPAQTLCWPTWERLGVITNYKAAVRYTSTIAPEDGVRRWIEEIRSAGTDEVMFLGRIGSALMPTTLRGFQGFIGLPDLPRLSGLAHFLGTVEEFKLFQRLRSTVVHRAGVHPCLSDFHIDGVPALPVSMLIEQACAVADWVVPPGMPLQHLTELLDITVDLPRLRLDPDGTPFTTTAVGSQEPEGWTVVVTVTTTNGAAGALTLRYQPEPPELGDSAPAPAKLQPCAPPETGPLQWTGGALGRPEWRCSVLKEGGLKDDDLEADILGDLEVRLPTVTPDDLWKSPFPPAPGIAPAAIEAAVRAARPTTRLHIGRIVACPGARNVDTLHGSGGGPGGNRTWSGSRDGRVVLRIEACAATEPA